MKTTVLGTGSWGTALAQILADNGNTVVMYGINKDEISDINQHMNRKFFGNLHLPETISATDNFEEALRCSELVIIAVPTKFVAGVLEKALPCIYPTALLVNASKGFDPNTNCRMTDTIRRVAGSKILTPIVSVIGPSHAEEVILRRITSICAVSTDRAAAEKVQHILSNDYIRLYVNTDEIGAEYCAAIKNIIAIASGILVGRGYGDNAKAALVTRGLAEMMRYIKVKGGRPETLIGLTGVGDLVVTCFSIHSRNYSAGLEIGRADSVEEFLKNNTKTVEGIYSCKVIYEDSKNYDFEMPIITELYNVLYLGKKPSKALEDIIRRPLKSEI